MMAQGELCSFGDSISIYCCCVVRQYVHGQTYQAHPMVCAAALKVQRIIQEQDLVAKVRNAGIVLESKLRETFEIHPHVGNIRGRGLFWAVSLDHIPCITPITSNHPFCPLLTLPRAKLEFVKDKASKEPFDPALAVAMAVHNEGILQAQGIMLYPGTGSADGLKGDHIIIAPPYNVTAEDIDMIVVAAQKAVNSAFDRILPVDGSTS